MLTLILTVVVGITCSGMKPSTAEYYQKCITDAGAELVILDRYAQDAEMAEKLMEGIDALIVPGKTAKDTAKRNTFDKRMIKVALRDGKPVLGICKGHQCINSFFKGKNVKIKEYYPDSDVCHKKLITLEDGTKYNVTLNSQCHSVSIEEGSILSSCLGGVTEAKINSSHFWAAHVIGNGLKVTARSSDSVVEAIEGENVLGVQFHPEFLYGKLDIPEYLGIFKWLVDKAQENKK